MAKPLALGIVGHPIGHTLSPVMHALAGRERGVPLSYGVFDVAPARLAVAVAGLKALSVDGFNVTVPHKAAVIALLDDVTPEAAAIGAVNTVVNVGGRFIGHNTDAPGFVDAVREDAGVDPAGKRVFLYGAGGAARGVAFGLAWAGAKNIVIANRNGERACELAAQVTAATGVAATGLSLAGNLLDTVAAADIIVNTTSVGMEGAAEGSSLPGVEGVRSGSLAVDIVYRPLDTPFLAAARERGAATQDGLWMLIRQGDRAFRLWTNGKTFPVDRVREAALTELNN
ncbi:MAG: shikimate dehydrogenase [Nitrospinae bacterium]|nr:shikimate dehydrogenase [Nitrospinota bacterium]